MKAELERVCVLCGENFWASVRSKYDSCPKCRRVKGATKVKPETALVQRALDTHAQLVAAGMPNDANFVRELRGLVNEAHTDYPLRRATSLEGLFGSNKPWREESYRKADAKRQLKQVLDREKTMLKSLTNMQVTQSKAEAEIIEGRTRVLEARIEYIQRVERLRKLAGDAPEAETTKKADDDGLGDDPDIRYAADRHRRRARERSGADQAVISEFFSQLRRVFDHPRWDRTERAIRIRALMDGFGKGVEDLPADVRKFMEREDLNV